MMKYYKCIFRFNARHSMGKLDTMHSHTFAIKLSVSDRRHPEMFHFQEFEDIVHSVLLRYTGRYLNEIPEFAGKTPTIEMIGDVFFQLFKERLGTQGYQLYRIEISENPLAEYSVGDEILLPMEYLQDCRNYWHEIMNTRAIK